VLDIDALAHDGRGIARPGGKVCFVDGALPGERVEARLLGRRARFEEWITERVLEASPERVSPTCPLVGRCGGCDLQHLAPEAQRRHGERVVLDLLARQAGLAPERLDPPLVSAPFGYRRRARLAVWTPRRGRPVVGFREAAGRRVVAVEVCPVLAPPLDALPGGLAYEMARLVAPGRVGHLDLALADGADGRVRPVLGVHCTGPEPDADRERWRAFGVARDAWVFLGGTGTRRCVHAPTGEDPDAGPAYALPAFDLRLAFEPGDFLQGNGPVNAALVARVVALASPAPGQRVLDAFAGLGNFALPLARGGAAVEALEAAPELVLRGGRNAEANGLTSVRFALADLATEPVPLPRGAFDAAVLDPPRAGARSLVTALAARGVPRIVYVSCDPATLARDARILADAGYRLESLALVDLFPQTHHQEALACFALPSDDGGRARRRVRPSRAARRRCGPGTP
jgi:23S rRNA (uracil1939-C5)-methyltransferase